MKSAPRTTLTNQNLKKFLELAGSVSYGSNTLIIQDGKAIQIEKYEKLRLTRETGGRDLFLNEKIRAFFIRRKVS